MNRLKEGQKVKYNERGLQWAMSCGNRLKGARNRWEDRIGKISRVRSNGQCAYVEWEGNSSATDGIPVVLLQLVE